jgi:hypothetical protein
VTLLGIDPEILRLAAQCLNHYVTPGPTLKIHLKYIKNTLKYIKKCIKKTLKIALLKKSYKCPFYRVPETEGFIAKQVCIRRKKPAAAFVHTEVRKKEEEHS